MRLKDEDIKEIARLVDKGYIVSKMSTKLSYPKVLLEK